MVLTDKWGIIFVSFLYLNNMYCNTLLQNTTYIIVRDFTVLVR